MIQVLCCLTLSASQVLTAAARAAFLSWASIGAEAAKRAPTGSAAHVVTKNFGLRW